MPAGRSVCMYTQDGELVETYESISMASRETGISRSYISMCANGIPSRVNGVEYPKTSAGGYVWKIEDAG